MQNQLSRLYFHLCLRLLRRLLPMPCRHVNLCDVLNNVLLSNDFIVFLLLTILGTIGALDFFFPGEGGGGSVVEGLTPICMLQPFEAMFARFLILYAYLDLRWNALCEADCLFLCSLELLVI